MLAFDGPAADEAFDPAWAITGDDQANAHQVDEHR